MRTFNVASRRATRDKGHAGFHFSRYTEEMNRRAALQLLGSFAPCARLLLSQQSAETKIHTADELKALLDKEKKDLIILDVRERNEIEELGTLEGYINIPMGEVEKRLAEIPKGKPLVVV